MNVSFMQEKVETIHETKIIECIQKRLSVPFRSALFCVYGLYSFDTSELFEIIALHMRIAIYEANMHAWGIYKLN